METWTTFWGWLLVVVLVVYTGLTIMITIGGFFDVKGMLSTMDDQHEQDKLDNDESDGDN